MWSRDTTADSCVADGLARSRQPGLARATTSESLPHADWALEVSVVSRADVQELLRDAVASSGFAVTLLEPTARDANDEVRIRGVSRGFEDKFEWREAALLGRSGRIMAASAGDICLVEDAKLRLAYECGAPYSCMRTLQKASGELCQVWQHTRGMSIGTDARTGEELWYLLAVHFDLTEDDFGLPLDEGEADFASLDGAARIISSRLRSDIDDMLAARFQRSWGSDVDSDDDADVHGSEGCVRLHTSVWKRGDLHAQLVAAGVDA